MTLSYLVSTAGHSQAQNDIYPHAIQTVLQLIEEGAAELGDEAVVGFTSRSQDGAWICERYCTYQMSYVVLLLISDSAYLRLLQLSDGFIAGLESSGIPLISNVSSAAPSSIGHGNLVALLCPTGLEFLLAWIALMRTGCGVLFVA